MKTLTWWQQLRLAWRRQSVHDEISFHLRGPNFMGPFVHFISKRSESSSQTGSEVSTVPWALRRQETHRRKTLEEKLVAILCQRGQIHPSIRFPPLLLLHTGCTSQLQLSWGKSRIRLWTRHQFKHIQSDGVLTTCIQSITFTKTQSKHENTSQCEQC